MGPGMGGTDPQPPDTHTHRANHSEAWIHGPEASATCGSISLEGAGGNLGRGHLAESQPGP